MSEQIREEITEEIKQTERTDFDSVEVPPVAAPSAEEEKEEVIVKTLKDFYNEKMQELNVNIRPTATLSKIFALFTIPLIEEEDGNEVSANELLTDVQFSTISRAGDLEIATFLVHVGKLPILISQIGNLSTMSHRVEVIRVNTQLSLEPKFIKFFSELKNITNDPIELIGYDFNDKSVFVEKESYIYNMIRETIIDKIFIQKGIRPYVNPHKNDLKTNPVSMTTTFKQLFEEIVNVENPFDIEIPDFVNFTENTLKLKVRFELKELKEYLSFVDTGDRYVVYDVFVILDSEDGNRISRYPLELRVKAVTENNYN